jgi:uncharacterized protein YdhG (YjbR/CyaY superfamily)
MAGKPQTHDEYLAALDADKRAALEALRATIREIVPEAEEAIRYNLPVFRLDGRPLIGYGAAAKHCAFYPWSSTTVEQFAEELKGYSTSKGTIRFSADSPLPKDLVRKLVEARIAENAGG